MFFRQLATRKATLSCLFGCGSRHVGGAMVVSGLAARLLAEETLPRLNPASA